MVDLRAPRFYTGTLEPILRGAIGHGSLTKCSVHAPCRFGRGETTFEIVEKTALMGVHFVAKCRISEYNESAEYIVMTIRRPPFIHLLNRNL